MRIEYATVDALFSDFTRNINEGGVFIETDCPAPLDSVVHLRFRLPGTRETLKVDRPRARGSSPAPTAQPQGMGVEFENLTDADRARINELVLAPARRRARRAAHRRGALARTGCRRPRAARAPRRDASEPPPPPWPAAGAAPPLPRGLPRNCTVCATTSVVRRFWPSLSSHSRVWRRPSM